MALKRCPDCFKEVSSNASSCIHCGNPLNTAPRCPTCHSTNISRITLGNKVGSALMLGIFAANKLVKSYQCNDCKCKW